MRHDHGVPLHLAGVLARVARLPDPFLARPRVADGCRLQRDGVRAGLVPGVLDGEFR